MKIKKYRTIRSGYLPYIGGLNYGETIWNETGDINSSEPEINIYLNDSDYSILTNDENMTEI